jgi:hypothetical protein
MCDPGGPVPFSSSVIQDNAFDDRKEAPAVTPMSKSPATRVGNSNTWSAS